MALGSVGKRGVLFCIKERRDTLGNAETTESSKAPEQFRSGHHRAPCIGIWGKMSVQLVVCQVCLSVIAHLLRELVHRAAIARATVSG
jgi:hypothetical protein